MGIAEASMSRASPALQSATARGYEPGRVLVRRHVAQFAIWGGYAALMLYLGARYAGVNSGMLVIAFGVSGGLWLSSEALRGLALRQQWFSLGGGGMTLRLALAVLLLPVLVQVALYLVLTTGLRLAWITIPGGADYRPGSVFIYWLNSAMTLGLWAAGWVSIQALQRYRRGEVSRLRAEAERNQLELEALRARLNPHFVFNALNNLRALINEDPERAREMVTRLSNTLRHALDHGASRNVTLAEELAVVDDYLAIEQVHFEQRLVVERAIDPDAAAARLPPMLLQLLVENAIKHGISRTPGGGTLRLEATVEQGVLRLAVENPGRLDGESRGHGVGLAYLRSRLGADSARFSLADGNGRVRATLEIPQ
jgi:hypothetical protein